VNIIAYEGSAPHFFMQFALPWHNWTRPGIGANGFEAPITPGVQFHDILTVSLGGVGTIENVINNTGGTANKATQVVDLVNYP
jgi:hypothetical protein